MQDKYTNTEKSDLIEVFLDENNKDPITLRDESGMELSFEQVCVVPLKGKLYVILKPIDLDGVEDDEAFVFHVGFDENGDTIVQIEEDENIAIEVFDRYLDLFEKARKASARQGSNGEDAAVTEEEKNSKCAPKKKKGF